MSQHVYPRFLVAIGGRHIRQRRSPVHGVMRKKTIEKVLKTKILEVLGSISRQGTKQCVIAVHKFKKKKNCGPLQNSRLQKCDTKKVTHWESTNIIRYRTKFRRQGDVAPGIWAPLEYSLYCRFCFFFTISYPDITSIQLVTKYLCNIHFNTILHQIHLGLSSIIFWFHIRWKFLDIIRIYQIFWDLVTWNQF